MGTRTIVEFSEEAEKKIAQLSKMLNISEVDVVRNALATYSFVHNEIRKNRKIDFAIIADEKIEKLIKISGIDK